MSLQPPKDEANAAKPAEADELTCPEDSDDTDGASDWSDANNSEPLSGQSIASSETIPSQSSESEQEQEEPEAKPPPMAKKKIKTKKLKKSKKPEAAAAPKPQPSKIKPALIAGGPPSSPFGELKKPKEKSGPRIVKYTSETSSGTAGRALKNAKVVLQPGKEPTPYPSVKAFREDPPSEAGAYCRVDVLTNRKPASYRAFYVKSLRKGNAETYYLLTNPDDDSQALDYMGVTNQSPALAKVALMQHKKDPKLLTAAGALDETTLADLGWPEDAEDALKTNTLPVIMAPELAQRILKTAPPPAAEAPPSKKPEPVIIPEATKKRPAAAVDDADNDNIKRFKKDLEAAVGHPIKSINFTVNF